MEIITIIIIIISQNLKKKSDYNSYFNNVSVIIIANSNILHKLLKNSPLN